VNAQQEAVALWKHLESRGLSPSIRKVVAMLRAASIPIDDHAGRRYLAAFAAAAPHPKALRHKITAEPPQPHPTPDAQSPHDSDTNAILTCAVEVSLPTKLEATPPPLDLGLGMTPSEPVKASSPPATPTPPVPAPARADRRSPAEQTADAALAGVRPTIEGVLVGMTWTAWLKQNRRPVVDMARSGMSAEEIIEAHAADAEKRGKPELVMAWFQTRIAREAVAESAPLSQRQREVNELPSVANGARGTAPDAIPPWERPPNHERFRPWSAEFEAAWRAEHPEPAFA
jgi:hypothetical protein